MSLQRVIEGQAQVATNIGSANTVFSATDQTLSDASSLLLDDYSTAQANMDSTVTPDQRKAAAGLIGDSIDQMLSLANYRQGDVYIYGGTANTTAPFVSEAAGIRYVGADSGTQAQIGGPNPLPVGLTGDEVFGAMSSQVQGYKDLSPSLEGGVRLADLGGAGGGGVALGTIVINDGTTSLRVDLAGADRLSDVIDKINDAGGGVITAALGPDKNLTISSTAPAADLRVTELGSGRAAHDLGIYRATGQGASFDGDNVRPLLTDMTRLADLAGGAGLDLSSGLQITNGGKTQTLSFDTDTTVGNLLNRINTAGLGVLARINASRTGIDVVNTLSGSSMTIGENGGTTAKDLGLRSLRDSIKLSDLNDGNGVHTIPGQADLQVTARDGSTFQVSLESAKTFGDVVDLVNAAATAAGVSVTAGLATTGNGLELTDATGGAGDLRVDSLNASSAASDLGIQKTVSADTLTGDDVNGIQPSGVFAHLAELRDALTSGDTWQITRATQLVKADHDQMVDLQARVGAVVQDLDSRTNRLQDQSTANQSMLSQLKDTDMAEAITRFQALQTALQANLQTGAQLLNMSLLDFLK